MFDSSTLLQVVVCGSLRYFRNFGRHVFVIANNSFWEVSQLGISDSTFNRLSNLVSGILALFLLYGSLDATLDHVLDEASLPALYSEMV